MTGPLYFEDVAVGQVFTTGTHTMTAERIKSFGAEFDPQPQHLNEASAARSPFGELVASGFHTASATLNLMIVAGGPELGRRARHRPRRVAMAAPGAAGRRPAGADRGDRAA